MAPFSVVRTDSHDEGRSCNSVDTFGATRGRWLACGDLVLTPVISVVATSMMHKEELHL
ncbi:hypothetical protein [Rhodococcus gordoniae]|uniref:hypothetical protein n=1 Tax=Rhodococcus gordoniae TaxID=223392 RepID=UPI0035251EAF